MIGLILIGLILWGYSPTRRLEAIAGHLFTIGIGKLALWEIDSDKLPWFLAYIPLPPPFNVVAIRLKWTEHIEGKEKQNEDVVLFNGKKEKKFKQTEMLDDGFIGYRDELVSSLRRFETASYKIQVENSEGYDFIFIVTLVFQITNIMNVIKIPSFKMLGQRQLENKLPAWAFDKTIDEIKNTDADIIKDPKCGIIVEDGKDLITDFNDKHSALGFKIDPDKVGIKIIEGEKVKNYFKLLQEKRETKQKTENTGQQSKLRAAQRKIEKADADQNNLIIKETLTEVRTGLKPMMDDVFEGKAKVAAARPNMLAEVNHEADETGEKMFEVVKDVVKSITGNPKSFKANLNEEKKSEVTNE